MDIATLVEVARKVNYVGFCTGLTVKRDGVSGWTATLIASDNDTTQTHGRGTTPELAISAVAERLREWTRQRLDRANRDKGEAVEVMRMLDNAALASGDSK